jgi:hypothetical protein
MPLRDHFQSPVADKHSWDALYGGWPAMMVITLNHVLPERYAGAPTVCLGFSGVPDDYEFRIYEHDDDRKLVAAVELVSPSNKDRPESRQAFVSKVAALL